ncbi:MAG: GNAT family N-acetyltransferase [Promethearchaeota archaeon]
MKPVRLDDGLIMRNGSRDDIPALLEHFRVIHGEGVVDQLSTMLEHYPRLSWEDSFIIEEPDSGKVVSCVILLQNSWALDGIEIPSVEMEAVGTLEKFRYQGHIRMLNDRFEERAAQVRPVIQAVAGIPNFYRNFGYEYAARLGGGYPVNPTLIPRLLEGEEEPVTFEEVDKGKFEEFLEYREKHLPSGTWIRKMRPEDSSYLIYETTSHTQESFFFYLVKAKEKTVGVFYLARWENTLDIVELYLDTHLYAEAIMRFALARAQEWDGIPVRVVPPNQKQVREHIAMRTQVMTVGQYAWYVKIPSIPRFIEAISPLFSERLKHTEFQNFTGELTLTTYKDGFTLSFENGAFKGIIPRDEKKPRDYHLRGSTGSLVRLFMGYESLDDIMSHEPDMQCAAALRPLVRALLPHLEASVDPFY